MTELPPPPDPHVVDVRADGSMVDEKTGMICKPPGPLEWRMDGFGSETYIRLDVSGRELTPELVHSLIDLYEFTQRLGGIRVELQ